MLSVIGDCCFELEKSADDSFADLGEKYHIYAWRCVDTADDLDPGLIRIKGITQMSKDI